MGIRHLDPARAHAQLVNKLDKVNQKPCKNISERVSKKAVQLSLNVCGVALGVSTVAKDIFILAGVILIAPMKLEVLIVRAILPGSLQAVQRKFERIPFPVDQVAHILVDVLGVAASTAGVALTLFKGSELNVAMQKGLFDVPQPKNVVKTIPQKAVKVQNSPNSPKHNAPVRNATPAKRPFQATPQQIFKHDPRAATANPQQVLNQAQQPAAVNPQQVLNQAQQPAAVNQPQALNQAQQQAVANPQQVLNQVQQPAAANPKQVLNQAQQPAAANPQLVLNQAPQARTANLQAVTGIPPLFQDASLMGSKAPAPPQLQSRAAVIPALKGAPPKASAKMQALAPRQTAAIPVPPPPPGTNTAGLLAGAPVQNDPSRASVPSVPPRLPPRFNTVGSVASVPTQEDASHVSIPPVVPQPPPRSAAAGLSTQEDTSHESIPSVAPIPPPRFSATGLLAGTAAQENDSRESVLPLPRSGAVGMFTDAPAQDDAPRVSVPPVAPPPPPRLGAAGSLAGESKQEAASDGQFPVASQSLLHAIREAGGARIQAFSSPKIKVKKTPQALSTRSRKLAQRRRAIQDSPPSSPESPFSPDKENSPAAASNPRSSGYPMISPKRNSPRKFTAAKQLIFAEQDRVPKPQSPKPPTKFTAADLGNGKGRLRRQNTDGTTPRKRTLKVFKSENSLTRFFATKSSPSKEQTPEEPTTP